MNKKILFTILGLCGGILLGFILILSTPIFTTINYTSMRNIINPIPKQVIGFLPYWLLTKAKTDYSNTITNLTYFALRIDGDGNILKLISPTEEEPGWYSLKSGRAKPFLTNAINKGTTLSLTLDSGDINAINSLITNPVSNGNNIVNSALPIMKQYGFSELNLDIEYTQSASTSSRQNFTKLISTVREALPKSNSLIIEISPIDAISQRLIDIKDVASYATDIVIMAYDYHAPDSFVTGPVAPLFGAGVSSEFDVETAVEKTLEFVSPKNLILGVPTYGYEWEILGDIPRSAIIPGSGVLASNNRVATFISSCATCSAQFDTDSQESYVFYKSSDTNTNHLIFFPDEKSTNSKIEFVEKNNLGGIALWALGYEGPSILNPIVKYIRN